jgi:hypothetical protein
MRYYGTSMAKEEAVQRYLHPLQGLAEAVARVLASEAEQDSQRLV